MKITTKLVLQVSTNGLISFGFSFREGLNEMSFSRFEGVLIAPLWTNLVADGPGTLFYRVSNNSSDLDILTSLIANATSESDYRPEVAVIATWDDVRVFRSSFRVSQNS